MKLSSIIKRFFFLALVVLVFSLPLFAEEGDSLDWDIDSVFDAPPEDSQGEYAPPEARQEKTPAISSGISAASLVKPKGITFDSSFQFIGGIAPGWSEAPWFDDEDRKFSRSPMAKMRADFGLDAQISAILRVNTVFYFEIPNYGFHLKTFFADYSLYDAVFFRAGKYNLSWGISPNFGFTDLLSRVPRDMKAGDSFILKADIPVGIGGFQVLALTRADLMRGTEPKWEDLGYGGKFNLALRFADFDLGAFYQENMPLRSFLSVKTTLGKTELYNEWLAAFDLDEPRNFSGAANIGVVQTFFNDKFRVNGELFYNAEGNAFFYQPETSVRDAEISPFISGFNMALNLLYRFGGKLNPRLFVQALYAPEQKSARLVPGLRLSPWPHMELYFAVPMALGARDGYYYKKTADPHDRPFSLVFLLSLKGSVRAGYYY